MMDFLPEKLLQIFLRPIKVVYLLILKYKPFLFFIIKDFFQIQNITKINIVSNNTVNEIMFFRSNNDLTYWRNQVFYTKEPETLEWISNLGDGVFFDIGANIGQYSIYFAKLNQGEVYSFEPSPINTVELIENINLNKLEHRIKVIYNPLSSKSQFVNFHQMDLRPGNSGGQIIYETNSYLNKKLKYHNFQVPAFSLDDFFKFGLITDFPNYLKIDVDGIESEILLGSSHILSNSELKSILVEVDRTHDNSIITKTLQSNGFKLQFEGNSQLIKDSVSKNYYNQIWFR